MSQNPSSFPKRKIPILRFTRKVMEYGKVLESSSIPLRRLLLRPSHYGPASQHRDSRPSTSEDALLLPWIQKRSLYEAFPGHPTPIRKHIRDLIRHLRIYLRWETFLSDAVCTQPPDSPLDEPATQALFRTRLDGLQTLNYADHKATLEICVFHNPVPQETKNIHSHVYECNKTRIPVREERRCDCIHTR
jgi:hypothetical protein